MTDHAMKSDLIALAVEVRHATERAVLIFDGDREVWLLLSLVELQPVDPMTGTAIVTLPRWLALEEGLN